MKKGKNILTGFLLVFLIAAVITTALVAGYKFVTLTNKDAEEKFKEIAKKVDDKSEEQLGIDVSSLLEEEVEEPFVYSDQNTRTYDGKKLYESYGYIFNDSGEVLKDFYDEERYSLNMEFDVDRKYGVFVLDRQCFLVNSDLEVTVIADRCDGVKICYEGTYICFEATDGIYLYNIETAEKTLISKDGMYPCVSPDGRTVSYFRSKGYSSNKVEMCISSLGRQEEIIDSVDGYGIMRAVSNDGNTVYYEKVIDRGARSLRCYHNGNIKELKKGLTDNCYFDRGCKTILFCKDDSTYFYDPDLQKVKIVIKYDPINSLDIFASYCDYKTNYNNNTIIDTDCFSDVIILKTDNAIYGLKGHIPEPAKLSDERYRSRTLMTKEGPTCIYDTSEGNLIMAVYKDGKVESRVILDGLRIYSSYVMNNDFTEGWCSSLRYGTESKFSHSIARFKPDESPIEVAGLGDEKVDEMTWDPLFERVYYSVDKSLYCFNPDNGETNFLISNCRLWQYNLKPDEPIELRDEDGYLCIIINNKIYKCREW